MKETKTIVCIVVVAVMLGITSCTEQSTYDEIMEIELDAGEKLIMATWDGGALFYLTESMEPDYQPKRKTFREKSSSGFLETTVVFVESR